MPNNKDNNSRQQQQQHNNSNNNNTTTTAMVVHDQTQLRKRVASQRSESIWNLIHEKERDLIEEWRCKRLQRNSGSCGEFWELSFTLETMKSFMQNINVMVLIHIIVSTLAVFLFQYYNVSFDINVALFVPPIVFPLAFSINSDYQRREKVLEDLAAFKSAGLSWYFCMREWKKPSELELEWLLAVRDKLVSLLHLLSEYLLTSKIERRKVILRAIYEDFSCANELTEKLRASKLPQNTAIISRSVHFIHLMVLAVERLRVVRDYRSPRSIRSFNKVVIIILIVILAPYFVHLGVSSGCPWQPYYFAVILAFIFSTLQGVQDKLDDPFDGLGEDDINVEQMDEWAPVLEMVNNIKSQNQDNEGTIKVPREVFNESAAVDTPLEQCRKHDVIVEGVEEAEETRCIKEKEAEMKTTSYSKLLEEGEAEEEENSFCTMYSNFTAYSSNEVPKSVTSPFRRHLSMLMRERDSIDSCESDEYPSKQKYIEFSTSSSTASSPIMSNRRSKSSNVNSDSNSSNEDRNNNKDKENNYNNNNNDNAISDKNHYNDVDNNKNNVDNKNNNKNINNNNKITMKNNKDNHLNSRYAKIYNDNNIFRSNGPVNDIGGKVRKENDKCDDITRKNNGILTTKNNNTSNKSSVDSLVSSIGDCEVFL